MEKRVREMVKHVDDPETVSFYVTRKFIEDAFPERWNCPATIIDTTVLSTSNVQYFVLKYFTTLSISGIFRYKLKVVNTLFKDQNVKCKLSIEIISCKISFEPFIFNRRYFRFVKL